VKFLDRVQGHWVFQRAEIAGIAPFGCGENGAPKNLA
jgi:hypothetical protein